MNTTTEYVMCAFIGTEKVSCQYHRKCFLWFNIHSKEFQKPLNFLVVHIKHTVVILKRHYKNSTLITVV